MKLLTIIALKERHYSYTSSNEIILRSLVRARIAEQFGAVLFDSNKKSECFLLGMFSLLDAILMQPMNVILENLPLSNEVKNALVGEKSEYDLIVKLIIAMERGDWETMHSLAPAVAPLNLTECYADAIKWASDIQVFLSE